LIGIVAPVAYQFDTRIGPTSMATLQRETGAGQASAFDPRYVVKTRQQDRADALAELQRTLQLIEDVLYHQDMADSTRDALEASAGGIRTQIMEFAA